MPVVLSRMFRPTSTAIEAVGYTPNYGVVVQYKNGSEYHCPSWGYVEYLNILRGPSAGHAVAELRAKTHREGRSFYKVVEGTHFSVVDTWDHPRYVPAPHHIDHPEYARQFAEFLGLNIYGPRRGVYVGK